MSCNMSNKTTQNQHDKYASDSRKVVNDATKIFFELPELYFNPTNSNKILDKLTNMLTYSMHKETMLYWIKYLSSQ